MSTGLTYTISEKVIEPIERSLASVGINSAFKAGLVFGGLTAAILWIVKPASLFDSQSGNPRPWALLETSEPEGDALPTPLPWYMVAGVTGYAVNLII